MTQETFQKSNLTNTTSTLKDLTMLTAKALKSSHGFFGRTGGVSDGVFASLQTGLSKGDNLDHVLENRRRVCAVFGRPGHHLFTPKQIHENHIEIIDASYLSRNVALEADGLITFDPDLLIGIQTADCLPILFEGVTQGAAKRPFVGAVHAGWKGLVSGVLSTLKQHLETIGADFETLSFAIGPAIAKENYEVGIEVKDAFLKGIRPAQNQGTHTRNFDTSNVNNADAISSDANNFDTSNSGTSSFNANNSEISHSSTSNSDTIHAENGIMDAQKPATKIVSEIISKIPFSAPPGRPCDLEGYFIPSTHNSKEEVQKFLFDLVGAGKSILENLGFKRIELLGMDTYANETQFFSCRRATHRSEPTFGNQISVIGLRAHS